MDKKEIQLAIKNHFTKIVRKDSKIHNAYMLVHSDKHGIHMNLAEGATGDMRANPQQAHFIASIGKLFTSTLIGIFVENNMLSYDDKISKYFDEDFLSNLHVYKGIDYSRDIKIRQLLNHTSGLHDYFTDKPKNGEKMIDMIFNQPTRFWSPDATVKWSKEHLKAHFPPGKGFHYSDTGYHILGLIIEKITGEPFHIALLNHIFKPLGMSNTYLAQYSEPLQKSEYPRADLYGRDINITEYRSLSIDYAGGGIFATSEDQFKFLRGLVNNELITKDTFKRMQDWAGFFDPSFIGIDYGYGLMNFKTIPILMPKKYNVWGNIGSTGSFLFYHPEMRTYIIGNLNQFGYYRKGIRLMLKVINILDKYKS